MEKSMVSSRLLDMSENLKQNLEYRFGNLFVIVEP